MDIDATWSSNNKCFNCDRDHFIKECKKSTLQCSECKFLGSSHNKDCSYWGKGSCQAHSIGIANSNQVQRQQQRDEPVRENTHLVLDTLASRLRSYHSIV